MLVCIAHGLMASSAAEQSLGRSTSMLFQLVPVRSFFRVGYGKSGLGGCTCLSSVATHQSAMLFAHKAHGTFCLPAACQSHMQKASN